MRCYRDLHIRDRKCITPRSLLAIPVFHCISKPRPPIFFFSFFLGVCILHAFRRESFLLKNKKTRRPDF